jgi:transcriptional regulator with XRE-family HTH domain
VTSRRSTIAEQHKPSCSRSIRRHGLAEGRDEEHIAQAIHEHCGVTLLRAHRLARGWTLQDVTAELRSVCTHASGTEPALAHQRVSRWENGADKPSPRYLDALCRLYRSRPDRLGFGTDYTQPPQAPGAAALPTAGLVVARAEDWPEPGEADCGAAVPPHLLSALRDTRAQADALLENQSVCAATVDRWEQIADEYRHRLHQMPLDVFLRRTVQDFRQLQIILRQRQPLEFQTRLYWVMAQLAGQIASSLTALGALSESLGWIHTARLAADEIGDRQLRAWLTAWEALAYFWDVSLTHRAVSLCQKAQLMAGSSPTSAGAFAASLQARVYARLGCRREALEAMNKAEKAFELVNESGNWFATPEQRLWYDRQNTLTRLGETKTALEAQEHATSLTSEHMVVDPVLLLLDRASCLITANEIDQGCTLACRALSGATADAGGALMWLRAREIDDICRSRGIRLESARSLHQIVTQATGRSRLLLPMTPRA